MKHRSLLAVFTLAIAAVMAFSACGASSTDSGFGSIEENSSMGWDSGAADTIISSDAETAVDIPEAPGAALPNVSADADSIEASQRKIIKNKELSVETLEFDSFISELSGLVTQYGGYIQDSTQNGSSYYNDSLRTARYTIRVPAEKFDEFTSLIGDMATVTYSYEYIDDVTAQYVDIEARLDALEAEQESFLRLMDQAQTIEEILQIQSYLTDVNYQIESYTAQINTYDSLISYSTLRLNVNEVERITQTTAKPGVMERIKSNLSDNLYNIGEDFKDLFVNVVSSLPYIAMFVVVIGVIALVAVLIVKKVNRAQATVSSPKKPESDSGHNDVNPADDSKK